MFEGMHMHTSTHLPLVHCNTFHPWGAAEDQPNVFTRRLNHATPHSLLLVQGKNLVQVTGVPVTSHTVAPRRQSQ